MGSDDHPTDEIDAQRRPAAAVADPPLIAPGSTVGERYRLERRLGYGGMAAVWLATDERLGRPVAVKVLSDTLTGDREYLDRFRREARVAAGLQHPNLVSVYDFGAGARPYLVMEYVPGGDLSERIEAGDVPDPEGLAAELLSALRHIHRARVLHRDIKPQNVLVDEGGRARLTDFGIAQPRDATSLTHTGKVIGTESYIAPEVMKGAPASERSDLYALGVVLADVAREGAPAAFWDLTDRLRDPDPERRPESAAAALEELDHGRPPPGVTTQPFAITPDPDPEPEPATDQGAYAPAPVARSRRGPLLAGLAIAALGVALVVGLVLGGGDDGAPDPASGGGGETASAPAAKEPKGDGGSKPAPASEPEPVAEEPAPEESTPPAEVDGVALDQQGLELVQAERYEEAIPILEQARDALADSGDTASYNYAIYNLATAYMGAGRPDDAIPLLKERMQWNDGQLDLVQATLDDAYAASGQDAPESGGGNGPAPDGGPPPWAGGDD